MFWEIMWSLKNSCNISIVKFSVWAAAPSISFLNFQKRSEFPDQLWVTFSIYSLTEGKRATYMLTGHFTPHSNYCPLRQNNLWLGVYLTKYKNMFIFLCKVDQSEPKWNSFQHTSPFKILSTFMKWIWCWYRRMDMWMLPPIDWFSLYILNIKLLIML